MTSVSKSLWCTIVLFIFCYCQQLEWDASNLPNPTGSDFKQCNMRSTSNICDPDHVLSESDRYRLNHELNQLESRTRQDHAPDFCQKKGITAAIAIVKHVKGGSEMAVKEMANDILRKWTLDNQCRKSIVYVIATEDRRFWAARDSRTPIYAQELTEIFTSQKPLFQKREYGQAVGNIIRETWEKALSKQGKQTGDSADDRGGVVPGFPSAPPKGIRPAPDDAKKRPSTMSRIPFWIWITLFLILLPLLCCCCCLCYCCFCKGTSNNGANHSRRQGPSDIETGYRGMSDRNTSRGGGGLSNIMSAFGGMGAGHLIGQMFRGGGGIGRRGMPANSGYQGGGAYPAAPFQPGIRDTGGKGLYPAAAVRDEGGGGGW
ncbi:unnamed protein product [Thelazia callipaeda]|uniref:TPM_phosphatase domain-containing protein n=1 Tax=Thelazia callipaeda TaxID=103827 RepID=A0A0N5D613_THECL|nr:unnamed protein product [Thelazia callipaeda]